MKGTIRQYVTLGVMMLLLILMVSMFPERNKPKLTGQLDTGTTVSKLGIPVHIKPVRSD